MYMRASSLVTTMALLIVGSLLLLHPSTTLGSSAVMAFQIPVTRPHTPVASSSFVYGMTVSTKTQRFLSSPSEQEKSEDEQATDDDETVVAAASKAVVVEEESPSYPLDVPSPILLASSMVIAIASTGTPCPVSTTPCTLTVVDLFVD